MNSLVFKRGLKSVETFKDLSKRLARSDEICVVKNPKKIQSVKKIEYSKSLTFVQSKKSPRFEVVVKEPLTFSNQLEKSAVFASILQENDENADKFLDIAAEQTSENQANNQQNPSEIDWNDAMKFIKVSEEQYPAEKADFDQLMAKPGVHPIFNLASIVNKSPTLQRLVDLGTNISEWERNGFMELAVTMDFKQDVVPRIYLLTDNGVHPNNLGMIFTKNPWIFEQDFDDLKTRLQYFTYRKFTKDQVVNLLLNCNCQWLNFKVMEIDARLGFMQKLFSLQNDQVRQVASLCPQIVLWEGTFTQLEDNYLAVKDWMGFEPAQLKKVLTTTPQVFLEKDTDIIQDRFDILHNEMGYSHHLLTRFPQALTIDVQILKARLKLLQRLGKDQTNPEKPNFVNPSAFAQYDDARFCEEVAKIPIDLYNKFLLTV